MNGRGVIAFDMDGVLVDVTESYREGIVRTVEHFTGRRIGRELIQQYKNAGGYNNDWKLSQQIAADLGVSVDYDAVVEYFNRIFLYSGDESLIHRERWIATQDLFPRLALRYDFAIFTGRSQAEAGVTLSRYAADIPFEPLVCHEDVEHSKPHPEGLIKIAAAYPGRRLWYVGDTVDDARCARGAGVDFIGVAAPSAPGSKELRDLLRAEGAAAVIDNINQLESVL